MTRALVSAQARPYREPMRDGPDLVVLGDVNPDLILRGGDLVPAFGQREHLVDEAMLTVGGSGAITACAAARLGLRVALCGVVGDDPFGRFMRRRLDERGVDTSGVVVDPDRPTGVTVVLSRPDDRAILTSVGTIGDLELARIDPGLLESARHIHVSSYFLQSRLAPQLPGLFSDVRASGATTSVDPNWDPSDEWDSGLLDLLPFVDVFMPNAAEAVRLTRVDDVDDAALALAAGGGTVVVKDGVRGGVAVEGERFIRATTPVVAAVDTTGAGDGFDVGFLAGRWRGLDLAGSLRLATACGALTTRSAGGVDAQPTWDEVLPFLGDVSTSDGGPV